MKTIIAVVGNKDSGKSAALITLYERLKRCPLKMESVEFKKTDQPEPSEDIEALINLGGHLIGIVSMGDPDNTGTDVHSQLLHSMASKGCEILICTARTEKGNKMLDHINTIATQYKSNIIWTSNLYTQEFGTNNNDGWLNKKIDLNEVFADNMLNLITYLLNI